MRVVTVVSMVESVGDYLALGNYCDNKNMFAFSLHKSSYTCGSNSAERASSEGYLLKSRFTGQCPANPFI